ncbi:flagellar basal body P-ring formation chaperone FlgA [Azospirillum argentinense]|uniref:Flagella basal body P-ring formation protein FlgA n=1 Tax=Azospirillum brasilense TaxID=192 RepID=A0A4D8PXR8_AZOBR|nr:flagellar basal body P-ring formation chaperone FlgA [Azospirillum argentinense]QCO01908.1 flagella basal body P-ring formation protein FlgA [Azospirillum argentinense]
MPRPALRILGTALLAAALAGGSTVLAQTALAQAMDDDAIGVAAQAVVYSPAHVEAVLSDALSRQITTGRLQMELDNRAVELRAPAGAGSLTVENLYYNPVQGRFAAEMIVGDTRPVVRLPVSGRAYGVVQVPVLSRRIAPGDVIGPGDVDWQDVRADLAGSDIAATDAQLIGLTPRRGVPVNQPVRLRDLQSPRVVDKGSLVTITLATENLTLSAQGKALQDGGRGDVIRVINTQSNRILEATVAGPSIVAVAKPGFIAK